MSLGGKVGLSGSLSLISIGTGTSSEGASNFDEETSSDTNATFGEHLKGDGLGDSLTASEARDRLSSKSAPTIDESLSATDLTVSDVAAYIGAEPRSRLAGISK